MCWCEGSAEGSIVLGGNGQGKECEGTPMLYSDSNTNATDIHTMLLSTSQQERFS
jgi:hypothetical protein